MELQNKEFIKGIFRLFECEVDCERLSDEDSFNQAKNFFLLSIELLKNETQVHSDGERFQYWKEVEEEVKSYKF